MKPNFFVVRIYGFYKKKYIWKPRQCKFNSRRSKTTTLLRSCRAALESHYIFRGIILSPKQFFANFLLKSSCNRRTKHPVSESSSCDGTVGGLSSKPQDKELLHNEIVMFFCAIRWKKEEEIITLPSVISRLVHNGYSHKLEMVTWGNWKTSRDYYRRSG